MLDLLELEMLNVLHMASQNLLEYSNVGRRHLKFLPSYFLLIIEGAVL